MSKFREAPEDVEKRRAVLRKAEFEINLAERELKEWKMHKKDSPSISEISSRTHILAELTPKTPPRNSTPQDFTFSPSSLKTIEKRLRDLEEVRQVENEKHRREIERLENMIDKMQDSRKIEPKFEVLQRAYQEKTNELERKNRELMELKGKKKGRNAGKSVGKPVFSCEEQYWKEKAFELSSKYYNVIKGMRSELDRLKKSCQDEMKDLRLALKSALNLCKFNK